jgi:transcriptional regulator with XRE-family HTH domain
MDRKVLFGKRIQELRKALKLSQEELAEKAGISSQYVSNIERGKENPTLDMLFILADALKVALCEMCDYEPVGTMDRKAIESLLRELLKTADPERLRTAVGILKVVLR